MDKLTPIKEGPTPKQLHRRAMRAIEELRSSLSHCESDLYEMSDMLMQLSHRHNKAVVDDQVGVMPAMTATTSMVEWVKQVADQLI